MRTFIASMFCVVGSVMMAADINETNIPIATAGGTKTTDYVRVLTNSSPNIADAKTRLLKIGDLLGLAGSQVWTNNGIATFPVNTGSPILLGTNVQGDPSVSKVVGKFSSVATTDGYYTPLYFSTADLGDTINPIACLFSEALEPYGSNTGFYTNADFIAVITAEISAYCPASRMMYANYGPNSLYNGAIGVLSTSFCQDERGQSAGFQANMTGNSTWQIGYSAFNNAKPDTVIQTNVCFLGVNGVSRPGHTNVGLYLEATKTAGTTEANMESALILLDTRDSATTPITVRTNNGTMVAKLDNLGMWTSQGTFSPSNATPVIPTAAKLGVGGYWTGNSNGVLVTVYSLDGATTVMKILAP